MQDTLCVLHSFSIKNIFYDKMDLRLFYFDVAKWVHLKENSSSQKSLFIIENQVNLWHLKVNSTKNF